ncbi:hypothetical protein EGN72_00815 [Pseudorhodobacter sp. E13]|nr:hypothetical protein EGN72_00815 [Pseudorhodobacter sp. E13]
MIGSPLFCQTGAQRELNTHLSCHQISLFWDDMGILSPREHVLLGQIVQSSGVYILALALRL